MQRTGTPRAAAWCMCSGQRSPSVTIARSGAIRDHARDENGHQSIGKYAIPVTWAECRSTASLWPVLVVVVSTTSVPSERSALRMGSMASISPTLTACSQILRTPGRLGGRAGGRPNLCQKPPPYPPLLAIRQR